MEVRANSKTMYNVAVALGCLPEFEGQSLLLKTSHTSNIRFGGMNLSLMYKPPLCRLAFMVQEGTMIAGKGGKQPIILTICEACEPQQ